MSQDRDVSERTPGSLTVWNTFDETVFEIYVHHDIAVDVSFTFSKTLAYVTRPFSADDKRMSDLAIC